MTIRINLGAAEYQRLVEGRDVHLLITLQGLELNGHRYAARVEPIEVMLRLEGMGHAQMRRAVNRAEVLAAARENLPAAFAQEFAQAFDDDGEVTA